tara:strand:- start:43 stop:534 length:492 start_codon:yes stop_codon:yes gene_type:complete
MKTQEQEQLKKFEKAHKFQDQVYRYFIDEWGWHLTHITSVENQYEQGENLQGIEIKHDQMFEKGSPNVFISVERYYPYLHPDERTQPSGIMKQHNKRFYIIGGKHKFYILPLEALRTFYRNEQPYLINGFKSKGNGTEKGFLLSTKKATELSFEIYDSQQSIL